MGKTDILTKDYVSDNNIFADIFIMRIAEISEEELDAMKAQMS